MNELDTTSSHSHKEHIIMATLTSRMSTLETVVAAQGESQARMEAMLAHLVAQAPAKSETSKPTVRKAKKVVTPAKDEAFVGWLKETAEARKARKASNAEQAAWLREKGLPTGGSVWAAVNAGERKVTVLRTLAKKDAAARKA